MEYVSGYMGESDSAEADFRPFKDLGNKTLQALVNTKNLHKIDRRYAESEIEFRKNNSGFDIGSQTGSIRDDFFDSGLRIGDGSPNYHLDDNGVSQGVTFETPMTRGRILVPVDSEDGVKYRTIDEIVPDDFKVSEETQEIIENSVDDARPGFEKMGHHVKKDSVRKPNYKKMMREEEKRKDYVSETKVDKYGVTYETPEHAQENIDASELPLLDREVQRLRSRLDVKSKIKEYYIEGALPYIADGEIPFGKKGIVKDGLRSIESDVSSEAIDIVANEGLFEVNQVNELDFEKDAFENAIWIGAERVPVGHFGETKVSYSLPVVSKGEEFVDRVLLGRGIEYNGKKENDEDVYSLFEGGFVGIINALKTDIPDTDRDEYYRVAEYYFNKLLMPASCDDQSIDEVRDGLRLETNPTIRVKKHDEVGKMLENATNAVVDGILKYRESDDDNFNKALQDFIQWRSEKNDVEIILKDVISPEEIELLTHATMGVDGKVDSDMVAILRHIRGGHALTPRGGEAPDTDGNGIRKILALNDGLNRIENEIGARANKSLLTINGVKLAEPYQVVYTSQLELDDNGSPTGRKFVKIRNEVPVDCSIRNSGQLEYSKNGRTINSRQVVHLEVVEFTSTKDGKTYRIVENITDKQTALYILELINDEYEDDEVLSHAEEQSIIRIDGKMWRPACKKVNHPGARSKLPGKKEHTQEDFEHVWDRTLDRISKIVA